MSLLINKVLLSYWKDLLDEIETYRNHPIGVQNRTFKEIIEGGKDSLFGVDHRIGSIKSYEEFRRRVPIRSYNDLSPYIERELKGEKNVLWNEPVRWFAKSSGTSAEKSKFIPMTKDSLCGCHYKGFQALLATYINNHPDSKLFSGKFLTLGGSIATYKVKEHKYSVGDLSGILLTNSPNILDLIRVPSRKLTSTKDFDEKNAIIAKTCSDKNITNFSGVPSWNLRMIEYIIEYNQKQYLTELWPNIELFMHGGISFEPYKETYKKLIPKDDMHYLENYNASEGYFAFQDDLSDVGMLLTLGNGIFYEFIPMDYLQLVLHGESDNILPLEEVKTGVHYAMVITTNGGLWRYLIGDCVKFTSTSPYKIVVTGRTQQFINTFGEELMIDNVEKALAKTSKELDIVVKDYTVAPVFMDEHHKGRHQWIVEFGEDDVDYEQFANTLDSNICVFNSDYEAKRTTAHTMDRLILTPVPKGTFHRWMASRGKIGGQNKVPRLSPERNYVESILHQRDTSHI